MKKIKVLLLCMMLIMLSGCAESGGAVSGENIAYGYGSAEGAFAGWMNSPGHYSAFLDQARDGEEMLMACAKYESDQGKTYWVFVNGSSGSY